MTNPLYLVILYLKMGTYTCVPVFVLQYLFIDRSDEYQTCNLILSFKLYQFLTALYETTSISYTMCGRLGSSAYPPQPPCHARESANTVLGECIAQVRLPRLVGLPPRHAALVRRAHALLRRELRPGEPLIASDCI